MKFELEGPTICLRLVQEEDASFICSLRTNEKFNTHLSKSSPNVDDQRQWILDYKRREAEKQEFYFIIHRKSDDLAIGTVRLYDFQENPKSYCWGSWILNEDKTRYAALESALLMYETAFNVLGFDQSRFDTRKDNVKVQSSQERLGAKKVSEDELNYYYILSKHQHEENKLRYAKFLS